MTYDRKPAGSPLTPKQHIFVREYMSDLNATRAAGRAGYKGKNLDDIGAQLIRKPQVQAEIAKLTAARAAKLEISAEQVLAQWWEMANVDVREIVEYKRGACRYCWGNGHLYQWVQSEVDEAVQAALDRKDGAPPDTRGGVGYDPNRKPHPECPRCAGDGYGRVVMRDTRELSPAAARIYAGVQVGKDGLKALLEARDKAREMVAKHLGMFVDRTQQLDRNGKPIDPVAPVLNITIEAPHKDSPADE